MWPEGSLEAQAERQLQRPRTSNLEHRHQPIRGSACTESGIQHTLRLSELGRTQIRLGIAEVRMVERVERLNTKLQRTALGHLKTFAERKIDLRKAKAADGVPIQISLAISAGN